MKQAADAGPEHAGRHLYDRLVGAGEVGLESRDDWGDIKNHMLALMPDQETLDAFAQHVGGVEVWFRITGFVARSLYTEVTVTIPQGSALLANLSNGERPDKLQCAMRLLGVDVDQDHISMSQAFDGYTVCMSHQHRDAILAVHKLRRRNFHLTTDIAVLLYEECGRRMGTDSQEYLEMMGHDNQALSTVQHPSGNGTTLRVPMKIFKTCLLLDIVIPRWDFNNMSGYIVSSDDPQDIDALERTAEWSRLQRDMAEGAAASNSPPCFSGGRWADAAPVRGQGFTPGQLRSRTVQSQTQ